MVKKLILFCLIFTAQFFAQDVKVTAATDSTHYLIGDPIKLRFEILHGQTTRIAIPDLQDSLKPFEILAADSVKVYAQQDGKVKEVIGLTIAAYDSVTSFSKAFTILYTVAGDTGIRSVVSNSILLSVSRIRVDTLAEIKDVKGPFTEQGPPWWKRFWWVLLILGIIIIVGALVSAYFIFRKNRPEKAAPAVILTNEQAAIKKLKELEAKQLWQKSLIKEYHSEITEIIREYFEKRYGIIALKLTTTETVEALKKQNAHPAVVEFTEEFLSLADMVKFAKHVPPFETNERMLSVAYLIVERSVQAATENGAKA
jgi:hypothetical protein